MRVIEEEEGILDSEEGQTEVKPSKAYLTALAMGKMVDMIEDSVTSDGDPGRSEQVPVDDIETLLADVETNPPELEDLSWSDEEDEVRYEPPAGTNVKPFLWVFLKAYGGRGDVRAPSSAWGFLGYSLTRPALPDGH